MKKQESSVLADLNKSPISSGHKLSSQGKFTMSCRAFCCCVFFTGAVLSFILSTILLFGVENYHKADPVQVYEIFETPKYALTNQLLDNNKYLILYGQSSSGILNFIEHEANLRVIEGKPVVIRQLDQNTIKKHMKETKHFVEMYLGQVGRGHHSWFILLNDTETPTHEITSLQTKYPHDTIVLITPKKLQIEGFTSHKFPVLKTKQLKEFMQKDLDMDKKEIKQIFDQSESKQIPDIFVSYKNHEQAKIRAAEQAERLKRQQQEEQRRLKQEEEKRKEIEAQRVAEQNNEKDQQDEEAQTKTKKGSKKSKSKASKSKKLTKIEAQEEQSKQVPQPKKSQKKSKSDKKSTKKPEVIEETVDTQVKNNQPSVQSDSEQKVESVPVTINLEQGKITQEPKKGKGKKNKKVKESIEKIPEQIVQVQHQIVQQIKVEIPEVIEPVVIEQAKQEKKEEETEKPKGKQQKNRKKQEKIGQKSKKGKKGSKKVKESPVVSQTIESAVSEQQKVTLTEQPEAVVSDQTSTEEVPVQVQQAQEPVQGGSDL